ncbi:MAG: T9SS type A sorting domain-containing protein [Candidatus Coatesbacteria bacterium]|nr:T9SS type A sorting domain-containing protein [Candidatus Coatesbacteria bacterium]
MNNRKVLCSMKILLIIAAVFPEMLSALPDMDIYPYGNHNLKDAQTTIDTIKAVGILVYSNNSLGVPTPHKNVKKFSRILGWGINLREGDNSFEDRCSCIYKKLVPMKLSYPFRSLSDYASKLSFDKYHIRGEIVLFNQFFTAYSRGWQQGKPDYVKFWDEVDRVVDYRKFATVENDTAKVGFIFIIATTDCKDPNEGSGYYPSHMGFQHERDSVTIDPDRSAVVYIEHNYCEDNNEEENVMSIMSHRMMHEFCHYLGLEDLYTSGFNITEGYFGTDNAGIGKWDIMCHTQCPFADASDIHRVPGPLSAFSLCKLGWKKGSDIREITESGEYIIYPIDSRETPSVLKFTRPGNECEYFLIELKLGKKHGYVPDLYHQRYPLPLEEYTDDMKQGGITIYHVDELGGDMNNEHHKIVDIECANGMWDKPPFMSDRQPNPASGYDDLDFWFRSLTDSLSVGGVLYGSIWENGEHPYWQWSYGCPHFFQITHPSPVFNASTNPNSNWYNDSFSQLAESGLSIDRISIAIGKIPSYRLSITVNDLKRKGSMKSVRKPVLTILSSCPNPVRNELTLVIRKKNIPENTGYIVFYDVSGRHIGKPLKIKSDRDFSRLAIPARRILERRSAGVYYYKIVFGKNVASGKILYMP